MEIGKIDYPYFPVTSDPSIISAVSPWQGSTLDI